MTSSAPLPRSSPSGPSEERRRRPISLQRTLIGKPNQVESVKANFEKRAPRFQDPS